MSTTPPAEKRIEPIDQLVDHYAAMHNTASEHELRQLMGGFREKAAKLGFTVAQVEQVAKERGLLKEQGSISTAPFSLP